LDALADPLKTPLQRGIAALRNTLGQDAADALLQPAPMRADEAACFHFPLPIDYTGQERRLRIGFPSNFPRGLLRLNVEPSPWLVWPHATKSGLCLHGFQERPIMGSPEVVVEDSLARLAQIVSLSKMGSSQATRDIEFQNEITTYWSFQHGQSYQNLLLLDRPQAASQLFALSDPRRALPSGQETVWLASNIAALKGHYRRVVGRSAVIRAAETPGFYVKLQTYPDIRTPDPEDLLLWLMQQIEQSIDRYLAAMDSADRATPEVAEAKAERLKEKIETLKKQMQKLKEIEAQLHDRPLNILLERSNTGWEVPTS